MKRVFFGASGSIVRWAYSDVIDNPTVEYCDFPYDGKAGLGKYVFSRKIGSVLPFFIKNILYPKFLNYSFFKTVKKEDAVLFFFACQYNLFFDPFFEVFIQYLKRRYPRSKCVFYYNDIVETCYPESLEMIKREFDLVLTFDRADAEKYGLEYYGEIYSKCDFPEDSEAVATDVFYVGSDRGRFDTTVALFRQIADADLNSVFYLVDVWDDNLEKLFQMFPDNNEEKKEIRYKNCLLRYNTYCPYQKTLAFIGKTKCLAEVLLPNQTGGSLRMAEAVTYGKKLLTNCSFAAEKPYFCSENTKVFADVASLTSAEIRDFVLSEYQQVEFDLSPLKALEYCEKALFGC